MDAESMKHGCGLLQKLWIKITKTIKTKSKKIVKIVHI